MIRKVTHRYFFCHFGITGFLALQEKAIELRFGDTDTFSRAVSLRRYGGPRVNTWGQRCRNSLYRIKLVDCKEINYLVDILASNILLCMFDFNILNFITFI